MHSLLMQIPLMPILLTHSLLMQILLMHSLLMQIPLMPILLTHSLLMQILLMPILLTHSLQHLVYNSQVGQHQKMIRIEGSSVAAQLPMDGL